MYNYEWDVETGGYVLTTKITGVTKEVRPVFCEELRLLKFDEILKWQFPNCEEPLLWAEGRKYIYKGEVVAEVSGGSLYEEPELKSEYIGLSLEPVDVKRMIEKNENLMSGLEQTTLKYIYDVFLMHEEKNTELIYVAFSGGKDSIVLLDLVQRALPHDKFHVLFADTTMELDDTYIAVDEAKRRWGDLNWHRAKADFDYKESWRKIGPPAEKMRWCCSIHKTAPQVLLVKSIINKSRFKTLVYVGVRAEESEARSTYEPLSESKKHIMQTSCCPILKWNTSELFIYMLANDLFLNKAYRKGLTRAGCIFCPMSSKWSFMINRKINQERVDEYVNIVSEMSKIKFDTRADFEKYYNERNWKLRLNGRDLISGESRVIEISNGGKTEFLLTKQVTSWKVWMSCIGEMYRIDENNYSLQYLDITLNINSEQIGEAIKIKFETPIKTKNSIRLMYLIRNALNKAAYCIGCKVCEVECPIGAIKFDEYGQVTNEGCVHCTHCLDREKGCIAAQSLSLPKGGNKMEKRNIAGYQTRGFRQDWLELFFDYDAGAEFWGNDRMGPNMFLAFKTWLRDSNMIIGDTPTDMCAKLLNLGSDSLITWGIIWANLAYGSPLVNWFITHLTVGIEYDNAALHISLGDSYSKAVKESAIKSIKETLKASPIGSEWGMAMANCNTKGNAIVSFSREGWQEPEPLVILYALYLFAEHCEGGNYNFTLSDLYDDSEDRVALSPKAIFGTDEITLKSIMQGLANNYSQFISVDFNKGIMENVFLNREKTAIDVLSLI